MKAAFIFTALLAMASPAMAQQAQAQPQREGRYQIVFSPRIERDTFLLDTVTGRVWQLTEFQFLKGDPVVWNDMARIDNDQDYLRVVREYGRKDEPPPAPSSPPKP